MATWEDTGASVILNETRPGAKLFTRASSPGVLSETNLPLGGKHSALAALTHLRGENRGALAKVTAQSHQEAEAVRPQRGPLTHTLPSH